MIQITIPYRLLLQGKLLRMHFGMRLRERRTVAWHVQSAMLRAGIQRPDRPYHRARVEVVRYSSIEPDQDNLAASVKLLLDILQPLSKRHPTGLGIIVNDDPAHLDLTVKHQNCPRKVVRTDITIERLA